MASFTIPFSKIKRIDFMNTPSGMTGSQVYAKYKPDYMINGALYDMASKKNITYLEDENVKSGFLFSDEGIGIKGDKDLVWIGKDSAYADSSIRDYVSGSPVLVKNGKINLDWGNKKSSQVLGSHARSFIGYNANYFYMCASDGLMTVEQEASTAIKAGCQFAINLDGGGSCHLQKGSTVIKKSTRLNASWVLIFLEKQPKNEPQNSPVTNEKKEVGVSTPMKKMKICLDAGHGGYDKGASNSELIEKDMNLVTARACKKALERCGQEVIMTRNSDVFVEIKDRADFANKNKADLFVSIHYNAGKGDRSEVIHSIYYGNGVKLAQNINAEFSKLGQTVTKEYSKQGSNGDYFGVIRETDMTAVIVEACFIDNTLDRMFADTVGEQEAIGDAIAKGICLAYNIKYVKEYTEVETELELAVKKLSKVFEDKAIRYLSAYEYGEELIIKIAKGMK